MGRRVECGPRLARLAAAAAIASLVAAGASGAEADAPDEPPAEWTHIGLLRVRDLTPFGILRLDFLPAHAVTASPGTWALEVNLSYQNTFVVSDNVAALLAERGRGERAPLSDEDVAAILALDGDAYLVDLELGLVDLTAHLRFTPHWGGYLTLPVLLFRNGDFDGAIESFHSAFGFSTANRDLLPRDEFQVVVSTDATELVRLEPPNSGLGDPVIGSRYTLFPTPERWNLIAEGAVKVPLSNERPFLSSGRSDLGVQLSFQRFFDAQALYLTASAVYLNGSANEITPDLHEVIPTVVAGWERRLSSSINTIVQLYGSRSVIQESTVDELTANKYFATVGLQARRGGWFYRFAFTENLQNFNNTPDVAATLSVARVVFPQPAS